MRFKVSAVIIISAFLLSSSVGKVHAGIGDWQKGITLRLIHESQSDVEQSLIDAAATGANYITITPGWVTDNKYSSNVERKDRTPTDEELIFAIEKAHELGMKVMLKPHLDRKNGGWRAFIDPSDKDKFFENYGNMLLHYAAMSEQYGVEQFSVGAELWKLTTKDGNEQYWRDIIADIRAIYSGALTYSANSYSQYFDEGEMPFWDALDYWGLSMYVEVADDNDPSIQEIKDKWQEVEQNYLIPMSQQINKPMLFAEIGYRSVDGAGKAPEDFDSGKSLDLQEQADLYQAFFEYWEGKDYFYGLHIWDWKAKPDAGGPNDKDYTPQNKPAEQIITNYFTSEEDTQTDETPDTDGTGDSGDTGGSGPTSLIDNVDTKFNPEYLTDLINTGETFYSDRSYVVTSLPDELKDQEFIRTRNGDKKQTAADFLKFDLTQDAWVYVAFDSRASQLPGWLSGWIDTGQNVETNDVDFDIFKKSYAAGLITLGGNSASPMQGAGSNYFVIASLADLGDAGGGVPDTDGTTDTTPDTDGTGDTVPDTDGTGDTGSGGDSGTGEPSDISGEIVVKEPQEGKKMSGEKKMKLYIDGLDTDQYEMYYNVEGRGDVKMGHSSGDEYKQEKIQFDDWNWHGEGNYEVVLRAEDHDGSTIDTHMFNIYVKD